MWVVNLDALASPAVELLGVIAIAAALLAGAYLVADGNEKKALRYYVSGYYYIAKRKGLLEETGLKAKR